jgi:cell wall-associated NlpC family hydrolase
MPALPSTLSRAARRAASLLALVTTFAAMLVAATPAAPASAAGSLGYRAVSEASHHRGQPYVYGAAGPTRFDCSGFTMYVFSRFGYRLPHNAAAQYNAVRHVSRSSLQVGDLLFFNDGGGIGHVGLYAGHGQMWHAPKSGDVVRLAGIYSNNYLVGRIG